MKKTKRSRYFELVAYNENRTHDDMITLLEDTRLEIVVSPIHDKDIKDDGTLKKAHYHIGVFYPTLKSISQVYDTFSEIGIIQNENQIKIIDDVKGFLDYLTHKNHPTKAQYKIDDIVCINQFTLVKWYQYSQKGCIDENALRREIKNFIKENDVIYYCDLSDYATLFKNEWEEIIDKYSSFWRSYLISREDKMRKWHEKTFLDFKLEELQLKTICEYNGIPVETNVEDIK